MRRFFLASLIFCFFFLPIINSSEILVDEILTTNSLWVLTANFTTNFDKVVFSINQKEVFVLYYNISDKIFYISDKSINREYVNSYSLADKSCKIVFYPLTAGKYTISFTTYKDGFLVEQKSKDVVFMKSSDIIQEIERVNTLYKNLESSASKFEKYSTINDSLAQDINSIRAGLNDLNRSIEVLIGALRENSKEVNELRKYKEEINAINQDVAELEERVNKLNNKESQNNPTMLASLGNILLPMGIVVFLIGLFFVLYLIKKRFDSNYDSGFPKADYDDENIN